MAKAKQENLDKIKQQIIDNKVCKELANQATNLVFGSGNPDAEILIIGEAPGKNEDLTGEPFVGAAGKFLNEMLDGIGLQRDDIYITNIVKYRPPDNRDPLPEEKEEFLPYLHAQLEVIQPKVVVTLGRHSMNCFLPGMQISKIHGQPQIINVVKSPWLMEITGHKSDQIETKWVVMPLYHPAAALYNGGMRQTLIDDFTKLAQIVNQNEIK
jgi:uracil-DNA glycosylase family 4